MKYTQKSMVVLVTLSQQAM